MVTESKCLNIKFENFINTEVDEDLFGKAERVNKVLTSGILTGNEGLGMQLMHKVQPESIIKEKNGKAHSVIMLGSNSYLNLSTNHKVIKAAKDALEKFGYGMGAVSNYAGITDLHRELEQRIAVYDDVDGIRHEIEQELEKLKGAKELAPEVITKEELDDEMKDLESMHVDLHNDIIQTFLEQTHMNSLTARHWSLTISSI